MKLLHYTRKVLRDGYGIEEYCVLTDGDEDKSRNWSEIVEYFRRDEFELVGAHEVEPSNGQLPLERELSA